jgi:hypothetical protein
MKTLDELDALYAEATGGPWRQAHHVGEPRALVAAARPRDSLLALDVEGMAIVGTAPDAALIVALVNAWPEVRERLRVMRETGDALADVCGRWVDEGMSAGDLATEMEAAAAALQGFALTEEPPR